MRTVAELLNYGERVFVYLLSESVCRRFYADAEAEGFAFGEIKPTQSGCDDIIAIHDDFTLSHTGFAGHMAFGCKYEGYTWIDYSRYISGQDDFIMFGDKK